MGRELVQLRCGAVRRMRGLCRPDRPAAGGDINKVSLRIGRRDDMSEPWGRRCALGSMGRRSLTCTIPGLAHVNRRFISSLYIDSYGMPLILCAHRTRLGIACDRPACLPRRVVKSAATGVRTDRFALICVAGVVIALAAISTFAALAPAATNRPSRR